MNKKKLNLFFFLFLVLIFSIFFIFRYTEKEFLIEPEIKNQESTQDTNTNISPISGLVCHNWSRRPIAIMLAGDNVARPLSGLSEADLVFEMPVITGEITRLMAVYVCGQPEEIGSLRSARDDFIPLAKSLDAIYAHWGGSHFAYQKLKKKIIDNLDALPNPYNAFYRKPGIQPPHNGFTSMERLINSAKKLGYRLEGKFEGYQHYQISDVRYQMSDKKGVLKINYPYPYNVEYQYNPKTNSYLRWRGNKPEIDRNNNSQIETKNVVIMRARSYQIEGQYNRVEVEGFGEMVIYQNGQEIKGRWQKDKTNQKSPEGMPSASYGASKLYFFDENEQEIKFVPGLIWIEIIEPDKEVKWKIET